VLVDEAGGVIAGHGRLLAASQLRLAEVPVIVARGWTEAQKRAFVLADNKLALNAGWDESVLRLELGGLAGLGFDLGLAGFSPGELQVLMSEKTVGLTHPDAAPPLEDPVSLLGDVWVLGRHRLICGSSTEADVVDRLLAGSAPHLMVTDPPYGAKYDAAWRGRVLGDMAERATGAVLNDDRADWSEAWALFPGDVAYVWHAGNHAHVVAESLVACGLQIRTQIVWVKNQLVFSRGDYHPQHEPCFYGVRDGADDRFAVPGVEGSASPAPGYTAGHEIAWYAVRKGEVGRYEGGRKQSTVWEIDKPRKSETGHSTQKPVECMKRPIENNSRAGDSVYEPFSGSGTTIIAGEMTGRRVYAVELSPGYVDVAVRRWQNFTGGHAKLESTGEPFGIVEADRRGRDWKRASA
jgi:DNA modification methylase